MRDRATAILLLVAPLAFGVLPVLLALIALSVWTGANWEIPAYFGAVAAIHLLYAGVAIVARRRKLNLADMLAYIATGSGALGLTWGVGIMIGLVGGSPQLQAAVIATTAGLVCWSIVPIGAFPAAGAAFLSPILVSFVAAAFLRGDQDAVVASLMIVALAGMTVLVSLSPKELFRRYLVERAELREKREIVRILLKEFGNSPSDWIWHLDSNNRIDKVSQRFAAAASSTASRMLGTDFAQFLRSLSDENAATLFEIEHDIAEREMFHDVVIKMDREDGDNWWKLTGKPTYDDHGAYSGYIGTASDITAQRLAERKINFLAHHDSITGLYNRGKFTDHLKHAVSRLERYGSPFTILYLDLDQFKSVNDSRGHLAGDKLLAEVAERIKAQVAELDVVARLGGDEFAIILLDQCDLRHAGKLAGRLVESICKPYSIDEEQVSVGVSIGIALAPINGTRPDQILRNADLALYRAKADGRATYRFFESHMDSTVRERRMLELELREAIKNGEFVLYYQPLISAETQKPDAFEALVRWNHPIRGVVAPAEFIPIAEQSGLIQQIGDWSIREACSTAARWPSHIGVAVNLSAKHFQFSDIVAVVRTALEETKLAPERLELEITESMLIQNPDEIIAKLRELKAIGVSIAMDDFGTGYSSLSYLLKFPFDKIKIDKSFVTASSEDIAARDILRTIVSLAKSLKIGITAEGVETQEQVEFLREIACNQLQGYYFAKALNEIDLAVYLMSTFVDKSSNRVVPIRRTA